jgi:hypothetical protein
MLVAFLFEQKQYTKTEPPAPIYAYDINLSSAENPLGAKPSVSLSEQEKIFLEALLRQPDSSFVDRISAREMLGGDTARAEYKSIPTPAISDRLASQESQQRIVINQPSQEASVVNIPPPPPPQKYQITETMEATANDLNEGFVEELKSKLSSGGIKLKPASERKLAEKKPRKKAEGTKIINPATGRSVLASGKIGKDILKNLPLPEGPTGSFDIIQKETKEKEKEPTIEEKAARRFAVEE